MVVNPICRRLFTIGKLASLHLANNNGTSVDKPLNSHGSDICCRVEVIPSPVAITRAKASNVVNILDS